MLLEDFMCYLDPVSPFANSDSFRVAKSLSCVDFSFALTLWIGAYLIQWTTDQTIYGVFVLI